MDVRAVTVIIVVVAMIVIIIIIMIMEEGIEEGWHTNNVHIKQWHQEQ